MNPAVPAFDPTWYAAEYGSHQPHDARPWDSSDAKGLSWLRSGVRRQWDMFSHFTYKSYILPSHIIVAPFICLMFFISLPFLKIFSMFLDSLKIMAFSLNFIPLIFLLRTLTQGRSFFAVPMLTAYTVFPPPSTVVKTSHADSILSSVHMVLLQLGTPGLVTLHYAWFIGSYPSLVIQVLLCPLAQFVLHVSKSKDDSCLSCHLRLSLLHR